MEELIPQLIQQVFAIPAMSKVLLGVTGLYMVFCAIASFTKTKEDDKVADKLRRFFSLPPK